MPVPRHGKATVGSKVRNDYTEKRIEVFLSYLRIQLLGGEAVAGFSAQRRQKLPAPLARENPPRMPEIDGRSGEAKRGEVNRNLWRKQLWIAGEHYLRGCFSSMIAESTDEGMGTYGWPFKTEISLSIE